ncbi:patched-related protein 9, partial [Trichinella spiralis]|uniref:patched-related protein 9 n=1 Tax=Trichinella spiralis TaxID=6334 RepID=UPI0001EFEFA7
MYLGANAGRTGDVNGNGEVSGRSDVVTPLRGSAGPLPERSVGEGAGTKVDGGEVGERERVDRRGHIPFADSGRGVVEEWSKLGTTSHRLLRRADHLRHSVHNFPVEKRQRLLRDRLEPQRTVVGSSRSVQRRHGRFNCGRFAQLVEAVRLDNTFLMLSAMSHTQPSIAAESRIPDAMAEAAVSITITVLTDVISFAVAVQLFCLYTCVAMMISFLYQLTFLLGLMVLHARNEEKGKHALLPCFNTVSIKQLISKEDSFVSFVILKSDENDWLRKLFCVGSSTLTNHGRPG